MSKRNKRLSLLNSSTLYALHFIKLLQDNHSARYLKGYAIKLQLGVTLSFLQVNIIPKLLSAKVLNAKRGPGGGYRIHPDANLDNITLEDLYVLLGGEPTTSLACPPEIAHMSVSKAVAGINEQTC